MRCPSPQQEDGTYQLFDHAKGNMASVKFVVDLSLGVWCGIENRFPNILEETGKHAGPPLAMFPPLHRSSHYRRNIRLLFCVTHTTSCASLILGHIVWRSNRGPCPEREEEPRRGGEKRDTLLPAFPIGRIGAIEVLNESLR